jgi:broad specificity phosphatase PhoE
MKFIVSLLFGLLLFSFAGSDVFAQHRKLTFILLRHAEKDLSQGAEAANPELSAEGKLRAERLVKIVEKYRPDAIYSTNYIRTRATVAPLARRGRYMVQIYEPRNLNQLAEQIMSGKLKRILVVGHNTTTPALANLLIKQDKYKALAESEYDKIWIVKVKKNKKKPNKIKDKVIVY